MADRETTFDPDSLYQMHVHQVGRWVARLGGPAIDLEDTVHEVFVIAYARLHSFRGDSTLATWLFGITDKVVRQHRRKERWWRWLSGSANETAGHIPALGPDPSKVAEQIETAKSVYGVLDQLAEGDRRILILFELEELSAYEVGVLLGITPANARLRLYRARARFLRIYNREIQPFEAKLTSERCEHVSR